MKFALFFLFCVLVFPIQAQTNQNIVKVTADGYSYLGEDETMKTAKERAMRDAEQKAVEQGTGLYVESFSKVHNSMLVDDDILSVAGGYLANKTTLVDRLESDPPRYHVQIEAEVKCGDLEKLIAAKKAEGQTGKQEISLDFAVLAERKLADGSWGEILVNEGGALKSGDKFQIAFQPNGGCYAYLLFYDSSGKASVLFPSKEIGLDNFIKKGREVRVPGKNLYYELDNVAGTETLYLVASQQPMADIDWLVEKMNKAGSDTLAAITLQRSILRRGIGKIVSGSKTDFTLSDGKKVEKVTEVVQGKGAAVRKLSFNHAGL